MEGEYEVSLRITIKKVGGTKPPQKQTTVAKTASKKAPTKKKGSLVDRLVGEVVKASTPTGKWVQTPQSTNIKGYYYFQDSKKLCIEFKSGSFYTYHNVPEEVYEEFGQAHSVGKAFHGLIRNRYSHTEGLPTREDRKANGKGEE